MPIISYFLHNSNTQITEKTEPQISKMDSITPENIYKCRYNTPAKCTVPLKHGKWDDLQSLKSVILWFWLVISRTLWRVSTWYFRLWGLMGTVLQFEAVRSFSFHYAKREAVPVRNCCWKKWVSEWLTVSSNMSKLKSVISHCSTVSGSQMLPVWIQAILFITLYHLVWHH